MSQTLDALARLALARFAATVEKEVPELGPFEQVEERFNNPDEYWYAGQVMLIVQMPKVESVDSNNKRFKIVVATPSGASTCSQVLFVSTKAEVVARLLDARFVDEVVAYVKDAAERLKEGDFA
jgi:hypothetical protein